MHFMQVLRSDASSTVEQSFKVTGLDQSGAFPTTGTACEKQTSCASEQRWLLQHGFRSILLALLCASSSITAMMLLVPGLYSGCDAASIGIAPIVTVLVLMPALIFSANRICHQHRVAHRIAKIVLFVPLLLGYYVPIVYYDSTTRVISGSDSVPSAPACVPMIDTVANHASDTMMLADVACNFFVCACLLETWRARTFQVVCHAALWVWDNSTYPTFTTVGTSAQRTWHWIGFLMVEAQMMATVLAITGAIDALWASQRAQSRLEMRIEQIKNEKERLVWDTVIMEHRHPSLGVPPVPKDLMTTSATSQHSAESHYTSKAVGVDAQIMAASIE